uniref:Ribosomal protein L32 n=1 Tax=Ditylenchus dipsaci TaxID=166011 RepID=A0A915EE21_9BILA
MSEPITSKWEILLRKKQLVKEWKLPCSSSSPAEARVRSSSIKAQLLFRPLSGAKKEPFTATTSLQPLFLRFQTKRKQGGYVGKKS